MDFLTNAIFREEDQSLYGAMITTFHPEVYTNRAQVHLLTTDELVGAEADSTLQPRGFKLSSPGVLMSDTSVRHVLVSDILEYVQEECSTLGVREKDITDFVLLGAANGAAVLANPERCLDDDDTETPILIPFSRLKVSNSAFNIYAPYFLKDSGYRTFSLLDNADGGKKEFYAVLPKELDVAEFEKGLEETDEFAGFSALENSTVYRVNLGLNGFYAGVGEAFLNFLAYNVAYYNVGLEVLTSQANVKPNPLELNMQKTGSGITRHPKHNLSIKHTYNVNTIDLVLQNMDNPDKFLELLQAKPACTLPVSWIKHIFQSKWYMEKEGSDEEKITAACINLKPECQLSLLRYSIELLSHRYHLYNVEQSGDSTIGLVLKGGGVSGEALKGILG